MSLFGILNVGGSALSAQQLALATTGNNIANSANPNYSQEVTNYSPGPDVSAGANAQVGSGVDIASIQRQVNEVLNSQLRSANSDNSSATTLQTYAGQVQSVFNALSGNDLSSQLNTFFTDWSALANNPSDIGQRSVVLQDGQNVTSTLNGLSQNFTSLSQTVNNSVSTAVGQVNQLTSQIASLNSQIVIGSATGQPNSLLDQRDADLTQLSQLVNIQTIAQPNGSVNVYLGSHPIVEDTTSQNLSASTADNNGNDDSVVTFQDGSTANVTSGSIGGLFQSQQLIDQSSGSVNSLASNLISSLNGIYSSGQGLSGYTGVTATNAVTSSTTPLSASSNNLSFTPTSGSFVITVTDASTGLSTSSLIPVNLTGAAGSQTTLSSLAASINAASSSLNATTNNGTLQIQSTDPNVTFSFSQDSSGVLSALGINTFFTGSNAATIGINSQVVNSPSLLAAAANGEPDDNTNALAIANLQTAPQSALDGASLTQTYDNVVVNVGSATQTASNDASAATAVQQTLTAQQQAISGVSTDQQALNMIVEQRSYQGAADLISTINTLMQSLLSII
jgi:flagellar hook-associated protein 1